MLDNSSQYWKESITNLGKNFCNCTRSEDFIEVDIENSETREVNQLQQAKSIKQIKFIYL